MAGLTREGFIPDTLTAIKERIEGRLEQFNPGFNFDPESPDGQLIGIFSAECALLWNELGNAYNSYDPSLATGKALRNIALLTGVQYGTATRSTATVNLVGVAGTLVPEGSLVASTEGYSFYTATAAIIPSPVQVIASIVGEVPVKVSEPIAVVESVINGFDAVTQTVDGVLGKNAEDEQSFRNRRNRTVMRNSTTVAEALKAKLIGLGIDQVKVIDNDSGSINLGVPAKHIHVVVGETTLPDTMIAEVIRNNKGLGVLTFGTTTVTIQDELGYDHDISFSKATATQVSVNMTIKFLDAGFAGAIESIKSDIANHINSLPVGEDVVWSHLFGIITPHGNAQVNSLEVGKLTVVIPIVFNYEANNTIIDDNSFATIVETDINIIEVV